MSCFRSPAERDPPDSPASCVARPWKVFCAPVAELDLFGSDPFEFDPLESDLLGFELLGFDPLKFDSLEFDSLEAEAL